jgi:hypothetical protein
MELFCAGFKTGKAARLPGFCLEFRSPIVGGSRYDHFSRNKGFLNFRDRRDAWGASAHCPVAAAIFGCRIVRLPAGWPDVETR